MKNINTSKFKTILLTVLVVLVLLMVLQSCAPPPMYMEEVETLSEVNNGMITFEKIADGVYRLEDLENGNLCYFNSQGGVFCLPIDN